MENKSYFVPLVMNTNWGQLVSVKELSQLIDTTALLNEGGLFFPVLIQDVKISYGQARYLVSPIGGRGSVWVNKERVRAI
jgi:hypothetical protein